MNLEDFKENLIIDKYNLDIALEQQAHLMYEVGEAYAEKVSTRDFFKEKIDTVDAEIAENLRRKAAESGEKITEASIVQKISKSSLHLEAHSDYLAAKKEAEIWGAMKDAYIQRGLALRELANLYTSNYFSNEPIKVKVEEASAMQRRERIARARKEQDEKEASPILKKKKAK